MTKLHALLIACVLASASSMGMGGGGGMGGMGGMGGGAMNPGGAMGGMGMGGGGMMGGGGGGMAQMGAGFGGGGGGGGGMMGGGGGLGGMGGMGAREENSLMPHTNPNAKEGVAPQGNGDPKLSLRERAEGVTPKQMLSQEMGQSFKSVKATLLRGK